MEIKQLIEKNIQIIKNVLLDSINERSNNEMNVTLAPLYSENFIFIHFREKKYDILVITEKEQLKNQIISGFVLGSKKIKEIEWKLNLNKNFGCNTYDNFNIIEYWNLK